MDQVSHTVIQFGGFELDLTRGCLRKEGREIELRPKPFEVLRHLAENRGRLISKNELLRTVWPNVIVGDDSLVQCIRELRERLADYDHQLIKTVPRRGYVLQGLPPSSGELARDRTAAIAAWPRRKLIGAMAGGVLLLAASVVLFLGASMPDRINSIDAIFSSLPRTFKDCTECPEMVALPAGRFKMGSPMDERGRLRVEGEPRDVTIAAPFAIGRFEVTVNQFETFVTETGFSVSNQCRLMEKIDGDAAVFSAPKASFRNLSYAVTGTQPVGCISLHDAQAFVAWLRRRTGKPYRLPTDAEWEYAARAGTAAVYSFGDDEQELCKYARFADLDTPFGWRSSCRSGIANYGPLPVGSLKPNAWGLFDMHGNIWEWVEDCWTSDPTQIPTDGSAHIKSGACETGVARGGSWASGWVRLRTAHRLPQRASRHDENMGFRVALSLDDRGSMYLPLEVQ